MTTNVKRWVPKILGISILVFTACNIFNPSGEGDLPKDSAGKVSAGQSYLKAQDWVKAREAFAEAIAQDSNNSAAYIGYAKAVRFEYNLNGLTLSKEFEQKEGGTQLPLSNTSSEDLTRYLQATSRIKPILLKFKVRDSLNLLYTQLTLKRNGKPYTASQNQLDSLLMYLSKANLGTPGYYKESEFPLMDGVNFNENYLADILLITAVHLFVGLKDINGDSTIDGDDRSQTIDNVNKILNGGLSSGNFSENMEAITEGMDSAGAQDLNAMITKMQTGAADINAMSGAISALTGGGGSGSGDSSDAGGEASTEVTSKIASLGDRIAFYKVHDGLDNDGDGCIDEEILDSKDNDGDGLVDEDFRYFPKHYGKSLVDSINLVKDSTFKDQASILGTAITLDTNKQIEFMKNTTFWKYDPNTIGTGKESVKDTISDEHRFKVLKTLSGKPPYNLSASDLDYAKKNIGGCWNMY